MMIPDQRDYLILQQAQIILMLAEMLLRTDKVLTEDELRQISYAKSGAFSLLGEDES